MAKIINVGILLLLLVVAAAMPYNTEAEEHAVGGSAVFNFRTGAHNVVTLSKNNYDKCNVNEFIQLFNTGPARITLNRTGEFYFACAIPTHCSFGQKLSINVTGSSSSSSPPGLPSAAMSVAATFSVLLMAIAINVLF